MVGLGRVELPTSPLSGVRSSQLSYRPILRRHFRAHPAGGAGRDRTGGLLSANQALSQLSYSPMAAPCRIQFYRYKIPGRKSESRPVGCRDHGSSPWPLQLNSYTPSGDPGRTHRPSIARRIRFSRADGLEWNGCLLLARVVHSNAHAFHKLHPRSLLERR